MTRDGRSVGHYHNQRYYYVAPDVELTGLAVFQRVCATCCDTFAGI